MLELLLVSQSPRRRKLLLDAGFFFRADIVKLSEIIKENVNPRVAVEELALTKAQAYLNDHKDLKSQGILLLSADTVVLLGKIVLGKPKDFAQAVDYLDKLSGKKHSVITAICLWNLKTDECVVDSCVTEIQFRPLVRSEIEEYVKTGEPMDKAGAYAIQGLARKFVEKIDGDFDNVVGLPLKLVEKILKERNWHVARK